MKASIVEVSGDPHLSVASFIPFRFFFHFELLSKRKACPGFVIVIDEGECFYLSVELSSLMQYIA